MKELVTQYENIFGNPDHLIKLKSPAEYAIAIKDPNEEEGEENTRITSLGLSLLSENDIELTMSVKGKLSEDDMWEIGLLFHTLHHQEFTEGNIHKELSVPAFGKMKAVMLRNWFYQETTWLNEDEQKTRLVLVIPLYAAEAAELEKIPVADRAYFVYKARISPEDPQREEDSIIGQGVHNTWANIAAWHKENGSNNAGYLTDTLTKKSNAGEKLEKSLNLTLPIDFKHSFNLIHERIMIGTFDLLPEEDIIRTMKSMNKMNAEGVFEAALYKVDENTHRKRVWWHEKWVPIGFNSGGDHLVLDMSPGPEGVPGQVLVHQNDQGPLLKGYHNFLEWLSDYNVELNRGEYGVSEFGHVLPADHI